MDLDAWWAEWEKRRVAPETAPLGDAAEPSYEDDSGDWVLGQDQYERQLDRMGEGA